MTSTTDGNKAVRRTVYALRLALDPRGDDSVIVGYFATRIEAAAHLAERDDLGFYFWRADAVKAPKGVTLPHIAWTRERVAEGRAVRDEDGPAA